MSKRLLRASGLIVGALGCSEPTPPGGEEGRSFAMGFTEFPSAGTFAAIDDVYRVLATDADFVNHHFDGGVPWNEALSGQPFPAGLESDLARSASRIPAGHVRLVSVSPTNFLRDGLADNRGLNGSEPLRAPWDTAQFDNPQVKQAFLAYCRRLIDRLGPGHFVYAIEANIVADKSPAKWPALLRLAEFLHAELAKSHPAVKTFPSIQLELLREKSAAQTPRVAEILAFSDVVAVSTYPYAALVEPEQVGRSYFDPVTRLAPTKPFAVAETAWPAETVTAPYPIVIPSDPDRQRRYVDRLLTTLDGMDALFVDYFFTRDYDDFWETTFRFMDIAPLVRIWKDTGLYAGDGTARPALTTWRQALVRKRTAR